MSSRLTKYEDALTFRQVERRTPTQERAKRRYVAILDAAAEVFSEVGFEAATIDEIAARADTSVGSIYQFFSNKNGLFHAIAKQCLDESGEVFARVLTPELMAQGWEALVEAYLESYFEWERTDIRVRALYSNLQLYAAYEKDDVAMMEKIIDQVATLLKTFIPAMKPQKRRVVATTVVNTTTSFLFLARTAPERRARALLGEVKLLLVRYLRPYVEGEGA